MRDILFRGFHPDKNDTTIITLNGKKIKGRWVYGYYVEATCHWHKYGVHKSWIVTSALQNGGYFNIMGRYAVIPETVCQHIGITDMHGNRIFGNDMLKARSNDYPYRVSYEEYRFKIEDKWGNQVKMTQEAINWLEVELIGNIYDNPELLEKE